MVHSEDFYRSVFEHGMEAVFLTTPDGAILAANPAACRLFGLTEEEICKVGRAGLVDASSPQLEGLLEERTRTGMARGELIFIRGDGSRFPGEISSRQFADDQQITRTILIVRDLTEGKKSEQLLAESEEQYRLLITAMAEGVTLQDENSAIIAFNKSAERILGLTSDQLKGRTSLDPRWYSIHEDGSPYPGETHPVMVTLRTGLPQSDVIMGIHKPDGTLTWISINVQPLFKEGKATPYRVVATMHDITERKKIEATLRESEKRYRTIVEQSPIGVSVGRNGICIDANQVCLKMFGYEDKSEMCGQPISSFFAPQSRAEAQYRIELRGQGKTMETPFEAIGLRKDGSQFPMYVSPKDVMLEDGPLTYGFLMDFTERKRAEADLRVAAAAFESQESLMITDPEGVILRVNKAFSETTGYSTEEIVGQTPRLLKSGRHDAMFYRAMWETLHRTGAWQGEIWDRRKNGEVYPKWLSISAVKGDDGRVTHYVGSHVDITERKASEEKIQHLAFYDHLTDLPNRLLLLDRLQQVLVSSVRTNRRGALLFIDLDNFKNLNDTLGHDMGDLLLKQVTQRLASCIREGDTVSRLGGDEFVVMLIDLSGQPIESAAQAEAIGEKILAALSEPYQLDKNTYRCTASIGVTLFGGNEQATDELMKQADIAMYQAKKSGRNALRFFDLQMQENISARVSLESELHNALEFQQFHLHYQIQVDNEHRPLGAEVLIRWIHPVRGLMPPDKFIPLAEETGLILPIGRWVLETACAQLKAWQVGRSAGHLTLAVNVSARQFHQADFVAQVQTALQHYAIDPRLLKLELTESLLQENIEETIATMSALNEVGVQFSLDDFGTGYSSLQYLKRLPLNQIKIDRSFVRDIATDSSDIAVIRATIAMARSLGLNIIAEGVETKEQRQVLLENGCTHFQGYLFGRPAPIEQFEASLRQR